MTRLRLILELRLDYIERARRYSTDDSCRGTGHGIDTRGGEVVGGPY